MLDEALFVTTDLFEATTPKPDFINPRCFGEDFAEWLSTRLENRGLQPGKLVQEDWGWALPIETGGRTFTLSIGIMDEFIGVVPSVWRIGLSYERFMNLRNLLRSSPADLFENTFAVLKSVLESEGRITISETEPEGR